MKKLLLSLSLVAFALSAQAQQLPNGIGKFDSEWVECHPWEANTYTSARGTQPEGWCISNVSSAVMPIVGSEVSPGYGGTGKAVKLSNVKASLGNQCGPGYISLGTTWATAEAKLTGAVQNADGGVFGGIEFTYHPDAVRLKYQCNRSAGSENISVVAYLWNGTWKQKDVPSNTAIGSLTRYGSATKVDMIDRIQNILGLNCATGGDIIQTGNLVASVVYCQNPGTLSSWTTQEFPLDYGSYAGQYVNVEKLNIVISANGLFDDRSAIKENNSVTIDDVELVYWHSLSALSYQGATLNFSENMTSYDLSSIVYDEAKLSYTVKGQAAIATKSYDEETRVLTIRVEGEDYDMENNSSAYTEYTIQFGEPGPEVVSTKTYSEDLYITVGGETTPKQVANVLVETLDNGHINFVLKNFMLGEGEDVMPVGNVAVNDIKVDSDGSFIFKGDIQIEAGDDPADAEWAGPDLTMICIMNGKDGVPLDVNGKFIGEDRNKVVAEISIDITSILGESLGDVQVHLGYARLAPGAMAVNAEAKYGTFCAPFAVTIPSGVQAYTVPSVTGGVLDLDELTGTIPANTPVVLYAESGYSLPEEIFEIPEEGTPTTPTVGLLTGVYEEEDAPVGSYVLQNLNNKVGFYQVALGAQPTVKANRCYLTVPSSGIKAYYLNEDDATGIKTLSNSPLKGENIYNLAGQRLSKMQKGINIVNGKKFFK